MAKKYLMDSVFWGSIRTVARGDNAYLIMLISSNEFHILITLSSLRQGNVQIHPQSVQKTPFFKRALLAEFSTKKTKTITVCIRKEAGSIVLV